MCAVHTKCATCAVQEGSDAAVNNPGSAYGVSALGPGAGGAGDSTPGNPDAEAGTRPEPMPSQLLQDGDTTMQVDGEVDGQDRGSQTGGEQQGLALPFEPVALVFKDIHYYVKQGGGDLELLRVCVSLPALHWSTGSVNIASASLKASVPADSQLLVCHMRFTHRCIGCIRTMHMSMHEVGPSLISRTVFLTMPLLQKSLFVCHSSCK